MAKKQPKKKKPMAKIVALRKPRKASKSTGVKKSPAIVATQLFDSLWTKYLDRVSYARQANICVEFFGDKFVNDHIAFRGINQPGVNIAAFEPLFLSLGYKKMDRLKFEEKKLDAYWYLPPNLNWPKVFVSELRLEEFSPQMQTIVKKYTSQIKKTPKTFSDAASRYKFLNTLPWTPPTVSDYEMVLKESEYAAWVLTFGRELNHFTILVNTLKHFKHIDELNVRLQAINIPLNTAGGVVKGTEAEMLRQSSTVAAKVWYKFVDGEKAIPYSYLEFAQRYPLPEHAGKAKLTFANYFQGFIPESADKIFESTYTTQVNTPARS